MDEKGIYELLTLCNLKRNEGLAQVVDMLGKEQRWQGHSVTEMLRPKTLMVWERGVVSLHR